LTVAEEACVTKHPGSKHQIAVMPGDGIGNEVQTITVGGTKA
jgi:hypothetical protein